MAWTIKITNKTADGQFPGLTVEAVIGKHRVQVLPGDSTTLTGTDQGRQTLNAHPIGKEGVDSASAEVNILGDFSNFICLVSQTGTALKLSIVSSGS